MIAKDFKLTAFATSEPTAGSDVAGLRCKAVKDGEDYILNGTKYWITNGGVADYVTVFATVDPKSRHEGICCFVVETEWEGVTIGRTIPKMGQRCSNTVGINLKNVRVPKENDPLDKNAPQAGQKVWRCRICGHVHYGDEAPEECPYCFFPKSAFKYC